MAKLIKQEFLQAAEANFKVKSINQELKYHQIADLSLVRTDSQSPLLTYKVQAKLTINQTLIAGIEKQSGRFILATNC